MSSLVGNLAKTVFDYTLTAVGTICISPLLVYVAYRIKEIAKENNIDIVENKPLARMLFHNVDIGSEIPPELYQAVAEVLAAVYKAKS